MENRNLVDALRTEKEKMANTYFFSTCIRRTNKRKDNKESSKNNFKTKNNRFVHSSGRGKQMKCENCQMENKSRLKSCVTCHEFQCKDCIKNEAVVKTAKRLRNPMLYICKSCLLKQTRDRVKPCPLLDLGSKRNSVEVKGNVFDNVNNLMGEIIFERNDGHSFVKNKGMCELCKYFKDSILVMETFFELLANAINISDNNENGLSLNKNELFWNNDQTVNSIINSYFDFPLQNALILCEDCFRNYVKHIRNFDESIFEVTQPENINSNDSELLYQVKQCINQFSEMCKTYHLMFEETLNNLFSTSMQNKSNVINNNNSNENSSKESTLTLDSINKKTIQLVQEFKGNIDTLTSNQLNQSTQYPMINYQSLYQQQYPYQYQHQNQCPYQYQYQHQHPYQSPSSCQFQYQQLDSLGNITNFPLKSFYDASNVNQFNHHP